MTGQEGANVADLADTGGDDSRFDVGVAHLARIYDYWLGGRNNFTADRIAGNAT